MTVYRDLPVTVTTFRGQEQELEPKRMNMGDNIHSQWLRKHIFWAVCNGLTVEIEPEAAE